MTPVRFALSPYLERIGLATAPSADADGLALLHQAHAFAVPFENIDILLGRVPGLESTALQAKLVAGRRGGYCYELNGLFALALEALGFAVRSRLARVLFNRPGPGPRSHQFLVVAIGGREWLADVGFGGPGLVAPMPLERDRVDSQHGARFRLRDDAGLGLTVLQRARDHGWIDLYGFAEESCLAADIDMANHFTATAPQSPFRRGLICVRPSATGRVTLNGSRLAFFGHDGDGEARTIGSVAELAAALAAHFGLSLAAAELEQLAPFLSA